jgi:hypothetical protein
LGGGAAAGHLRQLHNKAAAAKKLPREISSAPEYQSVY